MEAPATEVSSECKTERRSCVGRCVTRLRGLLRRRISEGTKPGAAAVEVKTPSPSSTVEKESPRSPTPRSASPDQDKDSASSSVVEIAPTGPPHATERPGRNKHQRRAQEDPSYSLFAKYGLSSDTYDWLATGTTIPSMERIQKPIRMRVRRTCHRCSHQFGTERKCAVCSHRRCQKCPRVPPRNKDFKTGNIRIITAEPERVIKEHNKLKKPIQHRTIPRPTAEVRFKNNEGKDLVHRPIVQSVRRTCHRCNAAFVPASRTDCLTCDHVRCTKCPRTPAKPHKYPNGYPGDAPASDAEPTARPVAKPERVHRKARQVVRWNCESCGEVFVGRNKTCSGCGHERGGVGCECKRTPGRSRRHSPAQGVQRLEVNLSRLRVGDPYPGSAAA